MEPYAVWNFCESQVLVIVSIFYIVSAECRHWVQQLVLSLFTSLSFCFSMFCFHLNLSLLFIKCTVIHIDIFQLKFPNSESIKIIEFSDVDYRCLKYSEIVDFDDFQDGHVSRSNDKLWILSRSRSSYSEMIFYVYSLSIVLAFILTMYSKRKLRRLRLEHLKYNMKTGGLRTKLMMTANEMDEEASFIYVRYSDIDYFERFSTYSN